MTRTIDLFSGCRGWDVFGREIGLDPLGIELDADACATSTAAGFRSIRGNIAAMDPARFRSAEGIIASPPCTDFSTAGARAGVEGESGRLIFEVPRRVEAIRPRWVACEQVPPVLEWWERFAHDFTSLGYRCWTGLLNAADYGVPQTRTRSFLLASLDRDPRPPEPTHARHPMPGLFGTDLLPWVSMADALGWGVNDRPCPTVTAGGGETGGPEPIAHSKRAAAAAAAARGEWIVNTHGDYDEGGTDFPMCEPSWTLTEKARSWWMLHTNRGQDEHGNRQTRETSAPAPALSSKAGGQWAFQRPAATVCADPRLADPRLADPGHRDREGGERQFREDGIRLTVRDALILQSFPPDYPLVGNKTSKFRQIGNAVPPLLARRVLEQVQ